MEVPGWKAALGADKPSRERDHRRLHINASPGRDLARRHYWSTMPTAPAARLELETLTLLMGERDTLPGVVPRELVPEGPRAPAGRIVSIAHG